MTVHTPAKQLMQTLPRSAASAFAPLQRGIDRLFDDFGRSWGAFSAADLSPSMDMVETKDGLELTFELPGLTRDQVEISLDDDVLTVRGEKKQETEEKDRNRRVVERSYGAFSRAITLPRGVDPSQIKASMEHGVLKIVAPKPAGAETRKIEIQSA